MMDFDAPEIADRPEPTRTPIDLDKLRSLAVLGQRTRDTVREGRGPDGVRYKATTDGLGNTVTEHANDRQDVTVRPQTITMKVGQVL